MPCCLLPLMPTLILFAGLRHVTMTLFTRLPDIAYSLPPLDATRRALLIWLCRLRHTFTLFAMAFDAAVTLIRALLYAMALHEQRHAVALLLMLFRLLYDITFRRARCRHVSRHLIIITRCARTLRRRCYAQYIYDFHGFRDTLRRHAAAICRRHEPAPYAPFTPVAAPCYLFRYASCRQRRSARSLPCAINMSHVFHTYAI